MGDEPFANRPVKETPKQRHPPGGIRWSSWRATENWAALVDDDNWGLGVWHPGVYSFIGGFAGGKPGAGGPKDGPCGYIAPLHREVLDHNIEYEYRYVLILDSLTNIRRHIYEHADRPSPPRYVFASDRQHWTYLRAHDSGWPVRTCLRVVADGGDMQLLGPPAFWQANPRHRVTIVAAAKTVDNRPSVIATVYWWAFESTFAPERRVSLELLANGEPHTYTVALGSQPGYRGVITRLRFDPIENSRKGDQVELYSLIIE
jgi:hypothetical protein